MSICSGILSKNHHLEIERSSRLINPHHFEIASGVWSNPESFIDEDLRLSTSDVLIQCEISGIKGYVYVLAERKLIIYLHICVFNV